MKPRAPTELELRPATLDDAEMVADLETARAPDDPKDPQMVRFWWMANPPDEVFTRMVVERNGEALAYVSAAHKPWDKMPTRFGSISLSVHPKIRTDAYYEQLADSGEAWLREEGCAISVARVRANFKDEIRLLERKGYREERRSRKWVIDLVKNRERLLTGAEQSRERMRAQGVRMLTLDRDTAPDRLAKLYEMSIAAEQDIPTTVPIHMMSYAVWHHLWFENPGIRPDRLWVAREGDEVVGISAIQYPPTRGLPWTGFTGTSRSVRGRGIARALKYETLAQAIALGAKCVGTTNDGRNEPILHLNAEIGYEPIDPVIELHRVLS